MRRAASAALEVWWSETKQAALCPGTNSKTVTVKSKYPYYCICLYVQGNIIGTIFTRLNNGNSTSVYYLSIRIEENPHEKTQKKSELHNKFEWVNLNVIGLGGGVVYPFKALPTWWARHGVEHRSCRSTKINNIKNRIGIVVNNCRKQEPFKVRNISRRNDNKTTVKTHRDPNMMTEIPAFLIESRPKPKWVRGF